MRRGLLSCPENTRPAVRVINVPPPYKVLNFRSVRKRNISRNTGTAATETLQYIRPGVKIIAPTKMLISVNFIVHTRDTRDTEAHIVLTKGGGPRIQLYRGFCKSDLFFEKVNFLEYCKSPGFELSYVKINSIDFELPSIFFHHRRLLNSRQKPLVR